MACMQSMGCFLFFVSELQFFLFIFLLLVGELNKHALMMDIKKYQEQLKTNK